MAAQSAILPLDAALFYFTRTRRRDSPDLTNMMDAFATAKTGAIMLEFVRDMLTRLNLKI